MGGLSPSLPLWLTICPSKTWGVSFVWGSVLVGVLSVASLGLSLIRECVRVQARKRNGKPPQILGYLVICSRHRCGLSVCCCSRCVRSCWCGLCRVCFLPLSLVGSRSVRGSVLGCSLCARSPPLLLPLRARLGFVVCLSGSGHEKSPHLRGLFLSVARYCINAISAFSICSGVILNFPPSSRLRL